ncbi:cAMP-mediated signaling protein sok1 [Coemansia sp. RSA 2050]|nr:cAMP-mediated signaling protein sok1 [Coemansia sp. RSA 2050]
MSESYTTQDNDYLSATHHTQPTSTAGHSDSTGPAGSAAATPDFLSNALSTSRASSSSPPAPGSSSGVAITGPASGTDCSNGSAGSMSLAGMVPSAAADDASCAGATSPTSALPPLSQSQIVDSTGAGGADTTAATSTAVSGTTIADGACRPVALFEPGSVALSHGVMAVCRGTKRRGSDSSVVFMAIGSSDSDGHTQSAYSTQTTSSVAAICTALPTTSSRKRRSLNVSPPESPASLGGFSPVRRSPSLSLSPSPSSATLAQPICGGADSCVPGLGHSPNTASAAECTAPSSPSSSPSTERRLLPRSARRLLLIPQLMTTRRSSQHGGAASVALRSADSGGGNLRRTQTRDGLSVPRDSDCASSPESLRLARARAASNGDINSIAQQQQRSAAAAGDRRASPACTDAAHAATAASPAECSAPGRRARGSDTAAMSMAVEAPPPLGTLSQRPIALSNPTTFSGATTRQLSAIPASATPLVSPSAAANTVIASASSSTSAPATALPPASASTPASRTHRQTQGKAQQAPSQAPHSSSVPAIAKAPVCTLPPINRYTLRELKIQNILQNPRLRHEVLFEPKLEFRPNSSGQLAEAKQRAVTTYWAAVDQSLRKTNSTAVATLVMLLVELREILAEMAEDSPRPELACHALELRERLDEERLRQQIAHGVFDAEPVVRYLATVMRVFARAAAAQREGAPLHDSAISRVLAYVQRGRVVRALRAAFDVLEAIKIDTANGSIEMYREYMRSTAVTFERSHFGLALQRSSLSLADTTEWWRRAVEGGGSSTGDGTPLSSASTFAAAAAAAAASTHCSSGASLDAIFADAAREMILDEGQSIPGLFRMDEGRILGIRREAERLAIVGMVFLAFTQFLQLAAAASFASRSAAAVVAPVMGEFKNANGRVEYERLAAECLLIVPEGCSIKWTEPLIVTAKAASAPIAKGGLEAAGAMPGEVGFSHLVSELVLLAERVLGRLVTCAEVAMLERTLLRTARYECPLREVVEERISGAIRLHTAALTALNGKVSGTECEAMPQAAKDTLRRSMLLFLAPSLSALSLRIHAVVSHHWLVYKSFYASSLSLSSSPLQPFPSLSPL